MDPSVGGKQASSNGQYGEIAGVECDGDVRLSVSVTAACVLHCIWLYFMAFPHLPSMDASLCCFCCCELARSAHSVSHSAVLAQTPPNCAETYTGKTAAAEGQ